MSGQPQTGSEIKAFRERLTALAQAGLRINESLDLDTVMQEVLECAPIAHRSRLWDHSLGGRPTTDAAVAVDRVDRR